MRGDSGTEFDSFRRDVEVDVDCVGDIRVGTSESGHQSQNMGMSESGVGVGCRDVDVDVEA